MLKVYDSLLNSHLLFIFASFLPRFLTIGYFFTQPKKLCTNEYPFSH